MTRGGFALDAASFAFKSSAFFFLRTKGRIESTGTYSFCTTGGLPYWKALQKCSHQSSWKCAGWSEARTTSPICFPYKDPVHDSFHFFLLFGNAVLSLLLKLRMPLH